MSDICSINADNYSSNENWTFINYLDTSNITNGKIGEIQQLDCEMDKIPSRARRKILPRDIVYSTVRPIQNHYGIIIEPAENMLVSTGFSVIRSSVRSISNEQIYLLLSRNETTEKLQQIAENSTTTYPSIKPSDIGNCVIVMPPIDVSMEFSRIVVPLFNQIEENNKQSLLLQNMRDTLLPKLMSGELDVSELSN